MGACCSVKITMIVKAGDREEKFSHIADLSTLKSRIAERLGIKNFELHVDGKKIRSQQEFNSLIHQRTEIIITVVETEENPVPEEIEPVAEIKEFEIKVPSKLDNYWGKALDESNKGTYGIILILNGYTFLHSKIIKDSKELSYNFKGVKGKLRPSHIEIDENFKLFKLNRNDLTGIDENCCEELNYRAKIHSTHAEISLVQDEESLYMYYSEKPISKDYLGSPVCHNNKLLGFVKRVKKNKVYVQSILELLIKLKKVIHEKAVQKENLQTISINALVFANSPKAPEDYEEQPTNGDPDEIIISNPMRQEYEAEGFEMNNIEIDFNLNLDYPHDNYCYYSDKESGTLIAYCSYDYNPKISKIDLDVTEGTSFTSTPSGLIIVCKNKVYKVTSLSEPLRNLNYEHVFHSSVWHKDRLYVISGKDCNKVEYLDHTENWFITEPLPTCKENAAVCSVNDSIYLMAGLENGELTNTVYKLKDQWELLAWISPWSYQGMGLLASKDQFFLFGGKGRIMKNSKFYILDYDGNKKAKGELPATGFFSNQSFGDANGVKSLFINKSQVLELSTTFKLVSISS